MKRFLFGWGGFLLLVVVGLYAFDVYRHEQSTTPKFLNYMYYGNPVSATVCPFKGSTFSGASQGAMYVDGTKFRADWFLATQGQTHHAHAVSLDGDRFYTWNDENSSAYVVTGQLLLKSFMFIGLADGVCSPWWFPDTSNFQIPPTVNFEPYTQ